MKFAVSCEARATDEVAQYVGSDQDEKALTLEADL